MAKIIANELGSQFKVTSGPAIARPGELAAILTTLQEHDVLFIVNPPVEQERRRNPLFCDGRLRA